MLVLLECSDANNYLEIRLDELTMEISYKLSLPDVLLNFMAFILRYLCSFFAVFLQTRSENNNANVWWKSNFVHFTS